MPELNEHNHTPFEPLLVKYLLQEAGPDEIRIVEDWLSADPANRRYYDQMRLIWEKSLRQLPDLGSDGEEERAWQTFRHKIREPQRPVLTFRWAAAAALLLPIALISFLWWRAGRSASWQTTASRDLVRTDTLPDGSIVTLNKHSGLSRPEKFKTGARTVRLDGEAFFRIAPDKNSPFEVQTGDATITVLGTSFNVRSQKDRTELSVETGLVSISNGHDHIQVGAGERITINQNDPTLTKQPAVPALYKYYQPRDFVCTDTPLWQLVDALNEAYGAHITIANTVLRNIPVNTTFHNEHLDRILSVLGETVGAKVVKTASGITLQ